MQPQGEETAMSCRGTVRAEGAEGGSGGFTADRPTETPDTAEAAAFYAALERIFAMAPAARGALLADAVGAATAHLADLAMVSGDAEAGAAARRSLARIDREMGELMAAMALRED